MLAGPRPLRLVQAGDPVLRATATAYQGQLSSTVLADLIEAMRLTMHAAPGVGLAAPQVGIGLRLAVLEDAAEVDEETGRLRERSPLPFLVIINPEYEAVGVRRAAFFEGCLSVNGYQAVVDRAADVRLTALDGDLQPFQRDFSGWPARIVQHETDHLNGMLYLDRAEIRSLTTTDHYIDRWAHLPIETAARDLDF